MTLVVVSMTKHPLVLRGELALVADVPEDAVAFWLQQGLLRSCGEGRRGHLLFDERDVHIAALLGEARRHGINVGGLRQLVQTLRHALAQYDALPQVRLLGEAIGEVREELDFASLAAVPGLIEEVGEVRGEPVGPSVGFAEDQRRRSPRLYSDAEIAEFERAKAEVPRERGKIEELLLALTFVEWDYLTVHRPNESDLVLERGSSEMPPHRSVLVFNLRAIFESLQWAALAEKRPAPAYGAYDRGDELVIPEMLRGLEHGTFANKARAIDAMLERVDGPSDDAKRRRLRRKLDRVLAESNARLAAFLGCGDDLTI